MISYFLQILSLFKTFFIFGILSYIYKKLYMSCTEKKVIKTKDGKMKKVIKTKIGLSLLYLVLLVTLYFILTWYVIFSLLLIFSMLLLLSAHKFEPSMLDILKKYDSHPVTKKIWFFYSLVVNLIFRIMTPFHTFLENKIKKNNIFIYEKLFEKLVNKDIFSIDSLLNNNVFNKMSGSKNDEFLIDFMKDIFKKTNDTIQINQNNGIEDNEKNKEKLIIVNDNDNTLYRDENYDYNSNSSKDKKEN